MTKSGAASDWSKDFVEHLRTVHFTLIVVAVALILTSVNNENARLSTALSQAQQIARLQKDWEQVLVDLYRDARRGSSDPVFALSVQGEGLQKRSGQLSIPESSSVLAFQSQIDWADNPRAKFRTIADFAGFWNTLQRKPHVSIPATPSKENFCQLDLAEHHTHFKGSCSIIKTSFFDDLFGGMSSFDVDSFTVTFVPFFLHDVPEGSEGYASVFLKLAPERELLDLLPPVHSQGTATAANKAPAYTLYRATIGLPTREVMLDEHFFERKYKNGWDDNREFKEAFPILSSLPPDLLTLDTDATVQRIASDLSRSEKSEVFFGLSIPNTTVSQWGVLVLLSVQAYFWLHLHEITSRISSGDEGWNVAWVGIYRSRVAEAVTAITCGLLPIIAAALLARTLYSQPYYHHKTVTVLSCLIVVTSVTLAILTVRRLRQLRKAHPHS